MDKHEIEIKIAGTNLQLIFPRGYILLTVHPSLQDKNGYSSNLEKKSMIKQLRECADSLEKSNNQQFFSDN